MAFSRSRELSASQMEERRAKQRSYQRDYYHRKYSGGKTQPRVRRTRAEMQGFTGAVLIAPLPETVEQIVLGDPPLERSALGKKLAADEAALDKLRAKENSVFRSTP